MNTTNIFLNNDNHTTNKYCNSLHEALTQSIAYRKLGNIVSEVVQGDGVEELVKNIQNTIDTIDSTDSKQLSIREELYAEIGDEEIIEQILYRFYATQDVHRIMSDIEQELGIEDQRYSLIRNQNQPPWTESAVFKRFITDIMNALRKKSATEKLIYIQAAQKGLTANLLNETECVEYG